MSIDPATLSKHVVPIKGNRENAIGTGFIIHSDEQHSYVVTCYHVVTEVGGEDSITVNNAPAKLVAWDHTNGGLDIAVLQLDRNPLIPVFMPARTTYRDGIPFHCAGYYRTASLHTAQPIRGVLGAVKLIHSSTFEEPVTGWELIVRGDAKFIQGYSGAPVVDNNGNVFAVVSVREAEGAVGLAISILALLRIWSNIPVELRERIEKAQSNSSVNPSGLMNLTKEREIFARILRGEDRDKKLIVIHGEAGNGKTRLVEAYETLCAVEHIDYKKWDFQVQTQIEEILDNLTYFYGASTFKQYNELRSRTTEVLSEKGYMSLTHAFITDLVSLERSRLYILLFDTYEQADWLIRRWLGQTFLPRIESVPLVAVVAGQKHLLQEVLTNKRYDFHLTGVQPEEFSWLTQEAGIEMPFSEIAHLCRVANGRPKTLTDYLATLKRH